MSIIVRNLKGQLSNGVNYFITTKVSPYDKDRKGFFFSVLCKNENGYLIECASKSFNTDYDYAHNNTFTEAVMEAFIQLEMQLGIKLINTKELA